MDAGHLRAWEHNDSPSHPLTSHIPNSNQGTQMPVTPINQTPISTTFLHHDRTLPSLSSVFENNSIRTASNHNPQPHDRSYPSEIKPSTTSDQGLKRPRLSHDQGRRSDSDIRSDSTRVTIPDRNFRGVGHDNYPIQESGQLAAEGKPKCSVCNRTWPLIQKILSGLRDLEAEILRASNRFAASSSYQQENEKLLVASHSGNDDLETSLAWAVRIIESGRALLGELTRVGPLSPTRSVSRTHLAQAIANATPIHEKSNSNISPEKGQLENNRGFFVSPISHDQARDPRESLVSAYDGVRNFTHDQTGGLSQSTQALSSREHRLGPGHPQSASASQPRIFPQTSRNPQSAVEQPTKLTSPDPAFSAHSAHVQDLQHQVSTKTLALQTLQREHDTLLAAFSRQQTSYSTLDKKTKVADIEIKELSEEKISLQSQVDSLEAQVEELFKSKEDAHQQSVASGAQYMKIMAMSSRLQAQSASDQKKWKAEKQEWETEKEALLEKIRSLEIGNGNTQNLDQSQPASLSKVQPAGSSESSVSAHTSHALDDLTSIPPEELRIEIVSLRQRCHEMETTFKELVGETENLDGVMEELTCVSRRIRQKARPELLTQQDQSPKQSDGQIE